MSTVDFRRESAPGGSGWREYIAPMLLSELAFVWQFRAPRVDPGVVCLERTTEGIVYGTGPKRKVDTRDYVDGEPPSVQGFYCAGRAFIEGKLQWLLRSTDHPTKSDAERFEDKQVIIWADAQAQKPPENPDTLGGLLTQASANGRSMAGFARQHWRTMSAWRPIGCLEREVEYVMRSEELGTPPYEYRVQTLMEPGTFEFPGEELCGVMYTAAVGTDLTPHHAYLVLRRPLSLHDPIDGMGGITDVPDEGPDRAPPGGVTASGSAAGGSSGAGVVLGLVAGLTVVGGGIALARHASKKGRRR